MGKFLQVKYDWNLSQNISMDAGRVAFWTSFFSAIHCFLSWGSTCLTRMSAKIHLWWLWWWCHLTNRAACILATRLRLVQKHLPATYSKWWCKLNIFCTICRDQSALNCLLCIAAIWNMAAYCSKAIKTTSPFMHFTAHEFWFLSWYMSSCFEKKQSDTIKNT